MKTRFHALVILAALVLSSAASSAWAAGDLDGEAARAFRRAERLVQQKRYEKAAAEFERASTLAGGSCPECLLGVGRAYSGAGQIEAAIEVTRMALPLLSTPNSRAEAYLQLGFLLVLQGETDTGRLAFQKALDLDAGLARQVRSRMDQALAKRAKAVQAAARRTQPEQGEVAAAGALLPFER